MNPLLREFLDSEMTVPDCKSITEWIEGGRGGIRGFTFNSWTLTIDLTNGVATIEDELDLSRDCSLSVQELTQLVFGYYIQ